MKVPGTGLPPVETTIPGGAERAVPWFIGTLNSSSTGTLVPTVLKAGGLNATTVGDVVLAPKTV